ncbi:elongation factor P--(R)-beta-lysine ligase [Thalassotalea sediminis]|uniref:elongation factor P--(R)-beta-lysine ligase n=1 Tax=Thalassotalea sediminis TaxID=1759089 RepID=UPI0025740084|nr:elongation factor P--(R)-beta-lysine ligase [Thalassotalea sediminis]
MFQPGLSWRDAKKRAEILHEIRNFFYQKGVVEVDTPMLSQGTVTDKYLEAFETQSRANSSNQVYYLQTSPEFALKRLLASGYQDIYQLGKAFRDEEQGRYHNPEFTMLEWYRLGFDHFSLMDEVSQLLTLTLNCEPADTISYQQLFINELDLDPLTADVCELKLALSDNGILGDWIANETDRDILLQVLFSECLEEKIGQIRPCTVYHFPSSQASLAKVSADNSLVAERFEVYFKGIELANGFHELTNAKEQRRRFEQDNEYRLQMGKTKKPIDERFISALAHGLPPCSGVALGIDRLIMLALELHSIDQSMCFTVDRA